MHKVIYTRTARRSLRRIAKDRVATIIGSINELASLEDPLTHQNVKAMKGDWLGSYRLRIGGYRAVFGLNPDPEVKPEQKLLLISVEVVGSRGGIYKK